jgi:hypothetical protein
MEQPRSNFENEPTTVWLIPCAWCCVKCNVIVGGADWSKGQKMGHMTRADVEKAFGGNECQIQETGSYGICPSCADKLNVKK